MPFDPHDDIPSQYFKWMCRHLVVLSAFVDEQQPDGSINRRMIALSGFVMILHDMPYWVTAGHCFRDLHKLMDAPGTTVKDFAFSDYFGLDAIDENDIPFTYERGMERWSYRPNLYLDFALLPIPRLTCRGFIANGVKAVSRNNWVKQDGLTFDHFQLLGVPKDFVGFTRRSDGTYKRNIFPHLVFIRNLTQEEAEEKPPEGWISGKIHENAEIKDIGGMSGGPIFGFRKNAEGQTLYFFCAAQSWWWPDSRIIYGCSLPLFGELMHDYVGYLLEEDDSPPDETEDFDAEQFITIYREIVSILEAETDEAARKELEGLVDRLRAEWTNRQGDSSLHDIAFSKPGHDPCRKKSVKNGLS